MEVPVQLVGGSSALRAIEQELICASHSDAKVLITGESGVGKEVVARLIHQRSRRSRGPFAAINCAGVPDSLLESEFFGHVRGSFTDAYRDKRGWLEQADGGTVFMDEIGEMSPRMQALLLRFLENGEIQPVGSGRVSSVVDLRVIAATNRDLMARIGDKSFRDDLYYRLNVIHVAIPPLRERKEDIVPLLAHFLSVYSNQHRTEAPRITDEARDQLIAYRWPGNVRELKNIAERLVVRTRSGSIAVGDLPREILGAPIESTAGSRPAGSWSTADALFERMSVNGESFWTVVYEPFMSRDLTREDLRRIVRRGLERTRGSYKALVRHFNLESSDYKRFLSFLRKYECHMPFQRFRVAQVRVNDNSLPEERLVGKR
jgi:transcriptional regulator with PAS, ATPase and Fis domain